MRRGAGLILALAGLACLGGCQTWQDQADTAALATCARIAGALERKTCQTEVMTAYGDAERQQVRKQAEAETAAENREALRQAYGLPKRTY